MKGLRHAFAQRVDATLTRVLDHLKFIDVGDPDLGKSGAHLGLTRRFGRAARGERVVEATPGYSGPHSTLVAALGLSGIQAPWVLEGAMDTVAFEIYVQQVLAPTLQGGDVVLIDNLSAHQSAATRCAIEARVARLEFLPPYSPDLNPIEPCWAKVKEALRTAKARTWDDLLNALGEALMSVTPEDAVAWFAHCGYALA